MEKFKKIKMYYKNPYRIFLLINQFKIFRLLSDEYYLKLVYKARTAKKLNLKQPISFNEKLQWLKLNDRKFSNTKLVDKYEVREFVANLIGEKYLIPLYSVYETVEEINIVDLPNQFVLKSTHDSGSVVIVKDKYKLDFEEAKLKLSNSFKRNYYYHGREWEYKNVIPKIVCEKYMLEKDQTDLRDYKFYCFNGIPKYIQVDFDRFENHKRNIYDLNWNFIPVSIEYPNDSNTKIKKPDKLSEMIELAKKLSKGFQYIRVDFYYINNSIFFGELTFYNESGFGMITPESYDLLLGDLVKIS